MTQRPALQRTSLTSGRDAQSTKIGSEIACCQAAYGGNEEMSSLTKCLARATPASGEAGHDAVVSSIYIPGLGKNDSLGASPRPLSLTCLLPVLAPEDVLDQACVHDVVLFLHPDRLMESPLRSLAPVSGRGGSSR